MMKGWLACCCTIRPDWWRWHVITHCPFHYWRGWELKLMLYQNPVYGWTGNWQIRIGPFWLRNDAERAWRESGGFNP